MTLALTNPGSVHYPDVFKAGDVAKCIVDNDWNKAGDIITVEEETVSFFNIWHYYKHYIKVN